MPHTRNKLHPHHQDTITLQGDYLEELQRNCGCNQFHRTFGIPTKKAAALRKRLYQKLKAKKESE